MTFAAIQRYALTCGLLLVPASLWNLALTERLPPSFAPAEFWRDIPAPLLWTENTLRVRIFTQPFLMPIYLVAPGTKPAIFVFAMVTLAYFASWLTPLLFPAPPTGPPA